MLFAWRRSTSGSTVCMCVFTYTYEFLYMHVSDPRESTDRRTNTSTSTFIYLHTHVYCMNSVRAPVPQAGALGARAAHHPLPPQGTSACVCVLIIRM